MRLEFCLTSLIFPRFTEVLGSRKKLNKWRGRIECCLRLLAEFLNSSFWESFHPLFFENLGRILYIQEQYSKAYFRVFKKEIGSLKC